MTEKAKMRGGPMNNKYYAQVGYSDRIEVQAPEPIDYRCLRNLDQMEPLKVKRGHYARSNMSLKNGTRIYVWMGWVE